MARTNLGIKKCFNGQNKNVYKIFFYKITFELDRMPISI